MFHPARVCGIALWLLAESLYGSTEPTPEARPSILLVLSDTHRADHVCLRPAEESCPVRTPTLARLATLGTTWNGALTVAPISAPAYASILTGRRPVEHGVLNNRQHLALELPTLAERLKANGYSTAAVVSNPAVSSRYGFGRGFDYFWDEIEGHGKWGRHVTDAALAWLGRRPHDRPFFLFLAYMDAHAPYFFDGQEPSLEIVRPDGSAVRLAAENRYVTQEIALQAPPGESRVELRFLPLKGLEAPDSDPSPLMLSEIELKGEGLELGLATGFTPGAGPIPFYWLDRRATLSIRNPAGKPKAGRLRFRAHRTYRQPEIPTLYRRGVESFDFHLGRLLDRLEANGELDDLAVIFVADHGELIGEGDRWGHVEHLRPETLEVPLIVKGPGYPAGERRSTDLQLPDLFGVTLSLAGLGGGPPSSSHRRIRVTGSYPPEGHEIALSAQGPRFRLAFRPSRGWELYDLIADPYQLQNRWPELADRPAVRRLVTRLREEASRANETELLDLDSLSKEELAELQALGYL